MWGISSWAHDLGSLYVIYVNNHVIYSTADINKHKCLQKEKPEFRAKVHGNGATSNYIYWANVLGNMSSLFILKDSTIISKMTLIDAYFCKKIFML